MSTDFVVRSGRGRDGVSNTVYDEGAETRNPVRDRGYHESVIRSKVLASRACLEDGPIPCAGNPRGRASMIPTHFLKRKLNRYEPSRRQKG